MLNHWRSSCIFHFCVKTRMCHMCLSVPNRLWAEPAACRVQSSLPQSLLRRVLSSNHRFSLFKWLLRDSLCDFCCTVTSSPWWKRRNNSTWKFVLFLKVFFYFFFLNWEVRIIFHGMHLFKINLMETGDCLSECFCNSSYQASGKLALWFKLSPHLSKIEEKYLALGTNWKKLGLNRLLITNQLLLSYTVLALIIVKVKP